MTKNVPRGVVLATLGMLVLLLHETQTKTATPEFKDLVCSILRPVKDRKCPICTNYPTSENIDAVSI